MEYLIVANWKANLSPRQIEEWVERFLKGYQPIAEHRVVLAVPVLVIERVQRRLDGASGVSLAAQGVSPFPTGSYTGATPAAWLADTADYALLGHNERRKYFRESPQEVAAQLRECVAAGITPILCTTREQAGGQVAALESEEIEKVILAYTPEDAEHLEKAGSLENVAQVAAEFGRFAPGQSVLYGGGVHRDNCEELLQVDGISGLLVGRGSLDPEAFLALLRNMTSKKE